LIDVDMTKCTVSVSVLTIFDMTNFFVVSNYDQH